MPNRYKNKWCKNIFPRSPDRRTSRPKTIEHQSWTVALRPETKRKPSNPVSEQIFLYVYVLLWALTRRERQHKSGEDKG